MEQSKITSNMATYTEEYYKNANNNNTASSQTHNNSLNSQNENDSNISNSDPHTDVGTDALLFININEHTYKVYINNIDQTASLNVFFDKDEERLCSNFKSASIVKNGLRSDGITGKEKRFSNERDKLFLHLNSDEYRRRTGRGKESRQIQGFTPAIKYYSPNYRKFDLPSKSDTRRTLLWMPQVTTNDKGEATIIFFTNARESETLDISVRGITKGGDLINWN